MVECVKLGKELPGLEKPPFPGELGQRIYEHVSQQAWEMWPAQATLIINHYGLSMGDPEARAVLREQMDQFFFGENARPPEGWEPPTQSSKGGGAPAAAPRKK
jgi:Fe-S cluster biosynthesis and repair protein YggX